MNYEIDYEYWQDDEFVITINGKAVGKTMHRKEAIEKANWLRTAIEEINELLNIRL